MARTVSSAPAPLQRDGARTPPRRPLRRSLRRNRPALMALGILVLMLIINLALQGTKPSVFEMTTLVNVCDRVIVLYRGKVACELAGADLTAERVLAAMLGDVGPQAASPLELGYSSHG